MDRNVIKKYLMMIMNIWLSIFVDLPYVIIYSEGGVLTSDGVCTRATWEGRRRITRHARRLWMNLNNLSAIMDMDLDF